MKSVAARIITVEYKKLVSTTMLLNIHGLPFETETQ